MAMPRSSVRVVCTFALTIVTLLPTSALVSVDLPAFGAPISAMKPQRVPLAADEAASAIAPIRSHALALEHGFGGGLFGRSLGAADPFGWFALRQRHGNTEFGIVMGPSALDLAIGRRRQAALLRPFLQDGLGVAQRSRRRAHALTP